MLSFADAVRLQKAGFARPRKFRVGQHWYTPEGRLGVVIGKHPNCVVLQFDTATAAQYNFASLIYAPTLEEIFDAIARAGKHRLLTKPPYGNKYELLSVTLHQYTTGRQAASVLTKEFCKIKKEG